MYGGKAYETKLLMGDKSFQHGFPLALCASQVVAWGFSLTESRDSQSGSGAHSRQIRSMACN
jgi:hypothetical protein